MFVFFFFFKQKTAYEMRISDWSSDVCSSDLANDVAADPRHETTRLALYDPRGIMRLFETFDPPIRERHAVDPPAQYVDPEERVLSRRPQGAFAEAVAPIARNHPHIGHQWLSRGKPCVCAMR